MISKIEMQAMDAVIGIHREMRKANEIDIIPDELLLTTGRDRKSVV